MELESEKNKIQNLMVESNELLTEKGKDEKEYTTPPKTFLSKAYKHQLLSVGAVLVLTMACGFPIGYSAILLPQLMENNGTANELNIDLDMGSWIASVHSLATPFGSFLSGSLTDYLGRRNTLMLSIMPMILGWVVIALTQSYPVMIIGRIICGFATGLLGGPAQVYIAETTDPALRNLLLGGPFIFYSIGILLVYSLGAGLHWRVVAWSGTILPIFSILALYLIPESPTWLLRHNLKERARKALEFLRADTLLAEKELNNMTLRLKEEQTNTKPNENICTLLSSPVAFKPLLIVILIAQLQMFSGVFIVIFYAVDFIRDLGGEVDTKAIMIWSAIVRTVCTIVLCSVLLIVRRRTTITVSGIGAGITSLILSIFLYMHIDVVFSQTQLYFVCCCLLLYITFNTPLMIMPGIMIGEVLPARIRGRAAGSILASMNITLFALAKYFPFVQKAIKLRGVFLLFSIFNFFAVIFCYLFQPETKGRTLDQIEDYFKEDVWLWYKRDKSYKLVKQQNIKNETV